MGKRRFLARHYINVMYSPVTLTPYPLYAYFFFTRLNNFFLFENIYFFFFLYASGRYTYNYAWKIFSTRVNYRVCTPTALRNGTERDNGEKDAAPSTVRNKRREFGRVRPRRGASERGLNQINKTTICSKVITRLVWFYGRRRWQRNSTTCEY